MLETSNLSRWEQNICRKKHCWKNLVCNMIRDTFLRKLNNSERERDDYSESRFCPYGALINSCLPFYKYVVPTGQKFCTLSPIRLFFYCKWIVLFRCTQFLTTINQSRGDRIFVEKGIE